MYHMDLRPKIDCVNKNLLKDYLHEVSFLYTTNSYSSPTIVIKDSDATHLYGPGPPIVTGDKQYAIFLFTYENSLYQQEQKFVVREVQTFFASICPMK